MLTCYVLLNVEPKKEEIVFKKLHSMNEVVGITEVFGEYDIIIQTRAKDITNLRDHIIHKIRDVDGVSATKTLITAERNS